MYIRTTRIQIGKNNWGLEMCMQKKVSKNMFACKNGIRRLEKRIELLVHTSCKKQIDLQKKKIFMQIQKTLNVALDI